MIQVLLIVETIFNPAKINTFPCMFVATLSFEQRVDGLDSLAYIESITNAYSQYFVKEIEHTENNKQCQK